MKRFASERADRGARSSITFYAFARSKRQEREREEGRRETDGQTRGQCALLPETASFAIGA